MSESFLDIERREYLEKKAARRNKLEFAKNIKNHIKCKCGCSLFYVGNIQYGVWWVCSNCGYESGYEA